jgi:hypothetical protein
MHKPYRSIWNTCKNRKDLGKSKTLRFDFSHFAKVTDEGLQQVEEAALKKHT